MLAGLSPEISNVSGYAIGSIFSYTTHKIWIFKSDARPQKEFSKYLTSTMGAYGLNLLTLVICVRLLDFNPYLSQFLSFGIYLVFSFLFLKYFTFKQESKIESV